MDVFDLRSKVIEDYSSYIGGFLRIEVGDIIDLFVRINSTGKALTTQEKRHARYFNSHFSSRQTNSLAGMRATSDRKASSVPLNSAG